MFEKEAYEYREKGKRDGYYLVTQEMEQEALDYIIDETFKDAAEFGYNKAFEWHYAKDEPPPSHIPLLCARGGKLYIAWYWDSIYHDDRCCQVKKPYAWKEIILPKESD